MKKIFKRLVCGSFLSIASIGCFNVEARLPKYMAQRAAELLIEKSGLQLKDGATKEAFAANLVGFLYSTEKRQHLANWMQNRINRGQIKTDHVTDAADTVNHFTDLFYEIAIDYNDNTSFRTFVNQHFPCWTGTLTCFMLYDQNIAKQILFLPVTSRTKNKYWEYKDGKTTVDIISQLIPASQKIIHVLFLLELIDTWNDVQKITESSESAPAKTGRYDPYDCCVPVPNTIYKTNDDTMLNRQNVQGSCMVSTIRNLLCILCRNESGEIQLPQTLRQGIAESLTSDLNDFVAGTTNPETLAWFARNVLLLRVKYEPTCALFISSLMSMLSTEALNEIDTNAAIQSSLTVLHGCESGLMVGMKEASRDENKRRQMLNDYSKYNFFAKYSDLLGTNNGQSNNNLLSKLFIEITGHQKLMVEFKKWPTVNVNGMALKQITSKTNWPEYQLIITDPDVNKKITIGLGHSGGGGQHIEIINVGKANQPTN